jgi:hypothetical protein
MTDEQKEKTRERQRRWREANREKARESDRKWRRDNPGKARETLEKYQKAKPENVKRSREKWRLANKDKVNEGMRRRRNSDEGKKKSRQPKNRLESGISNAIRISLNAKKAGRAWEILVGYSVSDLVSHLEAQFRDGMTWDNYGTYWHIDHIRPKSWFVYETAEDEEFKKCWSLSNLQPLTVTENCSKSNKYAGSPAKRLEEGKKEYDDSSSPLNDEGQEDWEVHHE